MPETTSQTSYNSGFDSPLPTLPRSGEKPSPAICKLTTPPAPGYEAFSFDNTKDKVVGHTPEGKNLIPLTGRQGRSHHHVRRDDDKSIICSANELFTTKNTEISKKEKQWLTLLAKLADLKKRYDQDYYRKCKHQPINLGHFTMAQKLITSCIDLIEACLLDKTEQFYRLATLNDSIINNRLYNPYIIKNIYCGFNFNLQMAKKSPINQPLTLPTSTLKQPNSLKRCRDIDDESVESSSLLATNASEQISFSRNILFKPRSISTAKRKTSPNQTINTI